MPDIQKRSRWVSHRRRAVQLSERRWVSISTCNVGSLSNHRDVGVLVPHLPVKRSVFHFGMSPPLLEKEGHALSHRLVPQLPSPTSVHYPEASAAFAAHDGPMDAS